ncbi:hypothetical protein N9F44_01080 [Akkermansiaceae bacterium]|nr:hypothetical protein [Akkermansiaceae bacterium]
MQGATTVYLWSNHRDATPVKRNVKRPVKSSAEVRATFAFLNLVLASQQMNRERPINKGSPPTKKNGRTSMYPRSVILRFSSNSFIIRGTAFHLVTRGVPGNSDGKVTDGKETVVDSFSFPTIPNFSKSMMVIQVLLFSESEILR